MRETIKDTQGFGAIEKMRMLKMTMNVLYFETSPCPLLSKEVI